MQKRHQFFLYYSFSKILLEKGISKWINICIKGSVCVTDSLKWFGLLECADCKQKWQIDIPLRRTNCFLSPKCWWNTRSSLIRVCVFFAWNSQQWCHHGLMSFCSSSSHFWLNWIYWPDWLNRPDQPIQTGIIYYLWWGCWLPCYVLYILYICMLTQLEIQI